jgi:hypothetical protein
MQLTAAEAKGASQSWNETFFAESGALKQEKKKKA